MQGEAPWTWARSTGGVFTVALGYSESQGHIQNRDSGDHGGGLGRAVLGFFPHPSLSSRQELIYSHSFHHHPPVTHRALGPASPVGAHPSLPVSSVVKRNLLLPYYLPHVPVEPFRPSSRISLLTRGFRGSA